MNRYREYDILSPIAKEGIAVADAKGDTFYLTDGSCKVDMDEMRVVLGQKNESFEQAIVKALRNNTTLRQSENSAQERLYEYLDETTGHDFEAVYLTSSGSEAVEAAVRIAQNITGKSEIITFWITANLNAAKAVGRSDLYLKCQLLNEGVCILLLLATFRVSVEAIA